MSGSLRALTARPASILLCLFSASLVACGGSNAEALSPDQFPPAERPKGEDAAPESAPAAAAADDAAWDGEEEAMGAAGSQDPSSAADTESAGAGTASKTAGKGEESRTTQVIAGIVKNNRKAFRECYEKGKKESPDLQGTLTLHFVLDPAGKVKLAEPNAERSDIKSPVVVDCAIGVLKAMSFPPSSRGMESTVNYPFDFKP